MEIPFGWTLKSGNLVPDENEQRIIELIESLRRQGVNETEIGEILDDCSPVRIEPSEQRAIELIRSLRRKGMSLAAIKSAIELASLGAAVSPVEWQQEAIRLIRELRSAGQTLQQIADRLAAAGIKTTKSADCS